MSGQQLYPTLIQSAVVATALKILLFPAYKSTDFEVHRNWLAITKSLPVKDWYFEKTSEWTLDYPPFFAYFEWLMSQAAQYVDPLMLNIQSLGYNSWETVYFQRATVIFSELILLYSLHRYVKASPSKTTAHAAALAIFLSPGLLIIDHIHFQYNGSMYGILILSIVFAQEGRLLLSGLSFAALLCMKHIYLYLAPAYFVYLLRAYCLSPNWSLYPTTIFRIQFFNCVKLGLGIAAVFGAAFGPFVYWEQIPQLMSRLFPFSRGLCHAYWAPNVWAMYSFTDRILIYLAPHFNLPVNHDAINSVTRGLVGDTAFAVLPEITPRHTFILTIGTQIPALLKLFFRPSSHNFLSALILTSYSSFLFSWHVHEKAILLIILPFTLLCLHDRRHLGAFRPLAVAGHVSLFPLLYTAQEFPVKVIYTILWLVVFLSAFDKLAPASPQPRFFLLDRFSTVYIAIAIPLILYTSLLHGLIFKNNLEQIPIDSPDLSIPEIIRAPYLKFGVEVPNEVEDAIIRDVLPGQTSVPTKSVDYDQNYVTNVTFGNQTLLMDIDSGSSDLWVISTLLNPPRKNQPKSRTYDPQTSGAKKMDGYSWSMSYGDRSTAGGPVYKETVTIGSLTVPNQAVEVATTISQKFRSDTVLDGLMGLGSNDRNNIRPKKQPTWFDNIRPSLAKPVFCTGLKRRAAGTFDFGFIDAAKFVGEIVYTPVLNGARSRGYWDFQPAGFAIGAGAPRTASFPAIVDTGSSQWYMPASIASAYWSSVQGAAQKTGYGWTFPCESALPDIHILLQGGKKVTVKGVNMNYKTIRAGLCWGGVQADIMGFSIFGDVFMKGLFVVHEVGEGGRAKRIGFAPLVE
ncbi:hypothetical protein EG327_010708 [Venturia inaequalis]|uniref:Alpha-1,3-glucosyltransferase n=1 Tax=Venturia inaequalis TaxID=5025 RepID=A0A8H3UH16_VENIN|nr:hypothetical protein EG327_010708 [Venturia inaequalis]